MWNNIFTYRTSDSCEKCKKDNSIELKNKVLEKELKVNKEIISSLRERNKILKNKKYTVDSEGRSIYVITSLILLAVSAIFAMIAAYNYNYSQVVYCCLSGILFSIIINRFIFHHLFDKTEDKTDEQYIASIVNRSNQ